MTIKTTQNENGRLVVELDPEKVPGDEKLPDPDDPLSMFVLKKRMDPSKYIYTGKPGRPRRIKKKRRIANPAQPAASSSSTAAAEAARESAAEESEDHTDDAEREDGGEAGDGESTGNLELDAVLAESGRRH